jgi:hypothetical protein
MVSVSTVQFLLFICSFQKSSRRTYEPPPSSHTHTAPALNSSSYNEEI